MKTNKELLNFYGVELGKRYKITRQASDVFFGQYENTVFEVFEKDRELMFEGKGGGCEYMFFIGSLSYFDYEEVKPEILTDKEKEYLSAVIKPFRDSILTIEKLEFVGDKACIYIEYRRCDGEEDRTYMPMFNIKDLYLGMKSNKRYTLKELGL